MEPKQVTNTTADDVIPTTSPSDVTTTSPINECPQHCFCVIGCDGNLAKCSKLPECTAEYVYCFNETK